MDFYALIPMSGFANIILVESKNSLVHSKAVDDVKGILGSDGITSSYNCYKPSALAIKLNSQIMSALLIIMLIFLVLYTFRTFLISINERQKDFGILYSLGWSRSRLIFLTMLEGTVQTITGSLRGLLLSFLIIYLLPDSLVFLQGTSLEEIPVLNIAVRSFCVTVIAGIIAGSMPGLTFLSKSPARIVRGR